MSTGKVATGKGKTSTLRKKTTTTVRKPPALATILPKREESYEARIRGLKFIFVQKVNPKKRLTEKELLNQLFGALPMNKKEFIAYLVHGEISDEQRAAIRDAAVNLWKSLKQYSGNDVNWKFINTELGIQGHTRILDLRGE